MFGLGRLRFSLMPPAGQEFYDLFEASANNIIDAADKTFQMFRGEITGVTESAAEIARIEVTLAGGRRVRLDQLATIRDAWAEPRSAALLDGKPVVGFEISRSRGASEVEVGAGVEQALAEIRAASPDLEINESFNFVRPVSEEYHGSMNLLMEGALLAVIVVWLFLRDWRSAFIVVINIPIALLAGTFALWMSGQNINLMTLGGLALAVGILVDEATVAIENIHVHLARRGSSRRKEAPSESGIESQRLVTSAATPTLGRAVLDATVETTGPRFLAMLCVLAVFIPAFLMQGAAKALFTPLALAVGFAMVASFVLSSTLVPVLSVWFLRGHAAVKEESDSPLYAALLRPLLAARWSVDPTSLDERHFATGRGIVGELT